MYIKAHNEIYTEAPEQRPDCTVMITQEDKPVFFIRMSFTFFEK